MPSLSMQFGRKLWPSDSQNYETTIYNYYLRNHSRKLPVPDKLFKGMSCHFDDSGLVLFFLELYNIHRIHSHAFLKSCLLWLHMVHPGTSFPSFFFMSLTSLVFCGFPRVIIDSQLFVSICSCYVLGNLV